MTGPRHAAQYPIDRGDRGLVIALAIALPLWVASVIGVALVL